MSNFIEPEDEEFYLHCAATLSPTVFNYMIFDKVEKDASPILYVELSRIDHVAYDSELIEYNGKNYVLLYQYIAANEIDSEMGITAPFIHTKCTEKTVDLIMNDGYTVVMDRLGVFGLRSPDGKEHALV